jgi:hypothetical protein
MGDHFYPSPQDVELYVRSRSLSRDLGGKMLKTVPREAYEEIGEAIGIRHNGVLVFDTEDVSSVLADCLLFDWYEDGQNLVQRYAETHPAEPGTELQYLLDAYCQAKYRVLGINSAVRGAGVQCTDVLNGVELFVMDLALSQTLEPGGQALATRTIRLGDFWMTSGAGLPIYRDTAAQMRVSLRDRGAGPGSLELAIVRSCLEAGAAEHIRYAGASEPIAKPRREPRFPGFKRRRPRN